MSDEALTAQIIYRFASAHQAFEWWQQARAGIVLLPPDFHWHGFAQAAATNAHRAARNGQTDEAEEWARLSIGVYITTTDGSPRDFSFECSAMLLRAWFIRHYGAQPGHAVRDPADLAKWFFMRKTMSLDEATAASKELRSRPVAEWRHHLETVTILRRHKNLLGNCRYLADSDIDPEIRDWMKIFALLP